MIELITLIVVCILSIATTRFLMNRKTIYGYFYIEGGDDPENPEEMNIRISVPSSAYYLDKKQIILRRGDSQDKQSLK